MARSPLASLVTGAEPKLDMAPLIDVSFLLLIFFLVAATLQKQEADLGLALPGLEEIAGPPVEIDQMVIRIQEDGTVLVNEERVDGPGDAHRLPGLNDRVARYRSMADMAGSEPLVVVDTAGRVWQQRFIDVLNICNRHGIHQVSLVQRELPP